MQRREFLRGLFGATFGGTVSSESARPIETDQTHTTVRKNTADSTPSLQAEIPPEPIEPFFELSTSSQICAEFQVSEQTRLALMVYMTELMESERFNALRAISNGEAMFDRNETLRDHAYRVFIDTIADTTLGRYLDEQGDNLKILLTRLSIDGQIPVESRWYNSPEDSQTTAVGYWQITPIALEQIAQERQLEDSSCIDRKDLTDATRGAAQLYNAHYRMMADEIETFQHTFVCSSADSGIPLLLTAYIYGPRLRDIIAWYTHEYANTPSLPGLDRTFDMLEQARTAVLPDGTRRFPRFGDHSYTYAKKCIAVAELAELQRKLDASLSLK